MKNLSTIDIHEFLSNCQASRVEGRTTTWEGKTYSIPYSTVKINNNVIKGLRENSERIELFEKLIKQYSPNTNSYLDVGSNLGVFVKSFDHIFSSVAGVECDQYYINQCDLLYPELKGSFIKADINKTPLSELINFPKDVITALSMIEYISDKPKFVQDLYNLTNHLCIVEGHSEDVKLGLDIKYENLLKSQPWTVTRLTETTDAGINAPKDTWETGRPVWVCVK